MKVLMVCLGNICRSPLAEGILKDKITRRNIDAEVHSAGTSNYHAGEQADPRTIEVANRHNINLQNHIARQFSVADFGRYDKIYTMDAENNRNVLKLTRNYNDRKKVEMLLNVVEPGSDTEVPDPYYHLKNGFEHIFRILDEACEIIADSLDNQ